MAREKYQKPKAQIVKGGVPADVNDEINKVSGELSMRKTQFVGMIIQLGLKSFIRSYKPESLLSEKEWKTIMEIGKDEEK